jgi:hypothetical protein
LGAGAAFFSGALGGGVGFANFSCCASQARALARISSAASS